MKKIGLLLIAMLFTTNLMAKNANLFNYDRGKVEKALITANVLDKYVSTHAVTAAELDVNNNPILANFKDESSMPAASSNQALGIPGFIWGLVLGWVGILIVYLVTEDQEETKQALYGCIVNAVLWVGCYFLLLAGTATAAAAG
ncbi:MAG: hypothetical protein GXO24_04715 [Chlorobi bacterium]|nr:hypothetical protein [Chlorobiota bacterium]